MFSKQHSAVSRRLAPAFDQRCPARLNGLPMSCLQALSTTLDPTGDPRFGQRLRRIRSLSASNWSMPVATALSRPRRGFRQSMTRATLPSFNFRLILSIHAPRSPLSRAKVCTAAAAYSMELIKDAGRLPSGQDLLADIPYWYLTRPNSMPVQIWIDAPASSDLPPFKSRRIPARAFSNSMAGAPAN